MAFALAALFGLTGVWAAFPATELLVSLVGVVFCRRKPKPALHEILR